MTWEWNLALAFNVAGSVLVAAFGVLVLLVRPRTTQATVVAAFAIGFGLATALVNLAFVAGTTTAEAQFLGWASGVASLVSLVALTVMWWTLPAPGRPRGAAFALALGMVGTAGAFVAWPILSGQATADSVTSLPHLRLYLGVSTLQLGAWWGLLVLLAGRLADEGAAVRGQTALLAGALALYPATVIGYLFSTDPIFARLTWFTLSMAMVASAAWLFAGHRAGQARAGRKIAWLILAVVLAGLIDTAVSGDPTDGGGIASGVGLNGLARIATVAVLAYAVVRHHVLGLDVKVRWGLSKGTIAAVFIGVFFIVSEAAQQYFGTTLQNEYVGILAAGMLVFAMAPLSRAADRLAERAIPVGDDAGPPAPVPGGREDRYRAVLRRFLRDGTISTEEERVLAHLAEDLRISAGRAFDLRAEAEAERGDAPPRIRRTLRRPS